MTAKQGYIQTVFDLLKSFRHLFISLIRSFSHYNLIQFMPTAGHPSRRPTSICSSAYYTINVWYFYQCLVFLKT